MGLSVYYRENALNMNWFRMSLAMPLVPVPHVKDAFEFVKSTTPDEPRVRYFNDYFDSTWMNGEYPIEMWDFFKYDGARTNHHVEWYHTRLRRKAGKIHPNIFEVVELFSQEKVSSLVSIFQLQSGRSAPTRRQKYINLDARLDQLRLVYTLRDQIIESHLWAIGHMMDNLGYFHWQVIHAYGFVYANKQLIIGFDHNAMFYQNMF